MSIVKIQAGQAARAFGNALVSTLPTTAMLSWLYAYAFGLDALDMVHLVCNLQPIRPLLELVAGA